MKIVATVFAVVFVVRVALESYENLSVITTLKQMTFFVFSKGPRMSTATYCNGPAGRNRRSSRVSSLFDGFSRATGRRD